MKFALNRYISDSCKEDAQTQLQEACDESDGLGYTEEYGDGPRTLTARGLDQINAAAMQKGDYIELVHSDILDRRMVLLHLRYGAGCRGYLHRQAGRQDAGSNCLGS